MLRRLWQASIYHPDAIDPDEHKYRSLKRVYIPLLDILMAAAGLFLVAAGAPSLADTFTLVTVEGIGWGIAGVSLACLVGAVFPRLWRLEIGAKIVLIVGLTVCLTALLIQGRAGFTVVMTAAALLLPAFRLTLLGAEIGERREVADGRE